MNVFIARLPSMIVAATLATAPMAFPAKAASDDGIVRVKSAVSIREAVARIKRDIARKDIKFFIQIDQSKLAAGAHIKVKPSTLLVFGNPQLGTQFLASNPNAGLDWPVRLLLTQDDNGDVWAAWTDFNWIAKRHGITDRDAQFKMATEVVQSITSTIRMREKPSYDVAIRPR